MAINGIGAAVKRKEDTRFLRGIGISTYLSGVAGRGSLS